MFKLSHAIKLSVRNIFNFFSSKSVCDEKCALSQAVSRTDEFIPLPYVQVSNQWKIQSFRLKNSHLSPDWFKTPFFGSVKCHGGNNPLGRHIITKCFDFFTKFTVPPGAIICHTSDCWHILRIRL